MADFHGFAPDSARARALDRLMQQELADSLLHIHERTQGLAGFRRQPLEPVIAYLRAGRPGRPAAFGWYYEMADALFAGATDEADAAVARLISLSPAENGMTLGRLGELDGSGDDIFTRRLAGDDSLEFLPAPGDLVEAFPARLAAGFDILDRAAPDLADEIRALVREVALAVGRPGAPLQFDGASSYQLWGLLLLNPTFHKTPVAVAEVLAHESGHSLLFGFTTEEPLVRNPDEDLFPSPLRRDPRPMDGIYHATYVSARMCWAMRRVAAERGLDDETRAAAEQAATLDVKNFADGHRVVAEHGDLTGTGKALMERAAAYMRMAA